jgi:hypothetical protein
MDTSAIVAEYGAEYKFDAKARQRLASKIYTSDSAWDKFWRKIPTESTSEDWGMADQGEVLQPYQVDWTPKGELTFLPNPVGTYWGKMDLEDIPDKIVKTWAGFLREKNITDPKQYSLIRYWIEDHILPRYHQDRYLAVGFLGEYVAPTAGTPGAASTTADGVRKIIRNLVSGPGYITPWVGGTFPTTAAGMVDYVENFWKAQAESVRAMPFDLCMRQTNYELYVEGRRLKYNNNYPAEADKRAIQDYPNVTIVPWGNMGTSNLIWASQASNRFMLQTGSVKRELLQVESAKRQVFLFTDVREGMGFDDPRYVFANDQDLS